jgi:hypothetical protein
MVLKLAGCRDKGRRKYHPSWGGPGFSGRSGLRRFHSARNKNVRSEFLCEEHSMNRDLEGFGEASLHVDLDYLPSFSFAVNEGALLGNRFITVHVKIDLLSSWIAVVAKHYLLGGSHASPLVLRHHPALIVAVPPRLTVKVFPHGLQIRRFAESGQCSTLKLGQRRVCCEPSHPVRPLLPR